VQFAGITDDILGTGLHQHFGILRISMAATKKADGSHPGRPGGNNSGGAVFDHKTVFRFGTALPRRMQEDIRGRFAICHFLDRENPRPEEIKQTGISKTGIKACQITARCNANRHIK